MLLGKVICFLHADHTLTAPGPSMPKTRIMYIENKSVSLNGPAKIGRVTFSKTGKSISYGGRTYRSLKGSRFKANYFDIETGDRSGFQAREKMARIASILKVPSLSKSTPTSQRNTGATLEETTPSKTPQKARSASP